MPDAVRIQLLPLDQSLEVERGTPLQDVLFAQGVEFPCGGRGRCKGCRVKVLEGALPATSEDERLLTPAERAEGWRLACRARADADLKLDLAQWETTILADNSPFAFMPQEGIGVAVDLGTTTVVAQLLDLRTGHVLAVRMGLNAQARHGADIMSRIDFALHGSGQRVLESLIREQIGAMIRELLQAAAGHTAPGPRPESSTAPQTAGLPVTRPPGTLTPGGEAGRDENSPGTLAPRTPEALGRSAGLPPASGLGSLESRLQAGAPVDGDDVRCLRRIVIVGNTVMHHLFSGVSVDPLSRHPFEPDNDGLQTLEAAALGWDLPGAPPVHFLPCLGSFVGSDILAGLLATRLHEGPALAALVDLGTNGEIVVGNRERLLCASTAAGPAFEGARISMGMRAATGAISEVHLEDGQLRCHVLGNAPPRGICGSGLVDAVAAGLELGRINPTGRFTSGETLELAPPVKLSQADVRELQLAKGAIAAGLRLLVEQWGATLKDLTRIYLAGAFGNYINRASARRIGLLNFPPERVTPAGNTALLGAKMALFSLPEDGGGYAEVRRKVRHVPLNEDPRFHEVFVEEMLFPG
jgi:uncharacterized 2Fe-2S/4Fe-4S cluster protein (DUF4445 family)